MKLALWTYEGPPHIGAMRVVNSMQNAHYVLHAPQGDTYADLLFTMIERQNHRPPVTYTTFQARDLGSDTANLFVESVLDAAERFKPDVMFVGESCTAELIQDQPGSLALGIEGLDVPVVPLEHPAYSRKENYGASEALYAVVRAVLKDDVIPDQRTPSVNLIGPSSLGFRCRDDIKEVMALLQSIGVQTNAVVPLNATLADIKSLPQATANVCLYSEVGRTTCDWLKRQFKQPVIDVVPIGVTATREFVKAVAEAVGVDATAALQNHASRLPWYSRSIDSNYLTGKRVFIFADATHAIAAARVASEELGFEVVGLGTYSREFGREVRAAAESYGIEALITDDYLEVEDAVKSTEPELVLGTQMERHMAKRLGIACCVISAPFHVEDVPARYSPQMGYEGANVIFDSWVHPLMMGLEEHLLGMFTDDFEFSDAAPSHLGSHASYASDSPTGDAITPQQVTPGNIDAVANAAASQTNTAQTDTSQIKTEADGLQGNDSLWTVDAERELKKIPFFVRGKAKRNTERYAGQFGLQTITLETLYDAKAHYSGS